MTQRMKMFAIVSLMPIPLITLAAVFGGWFVVVALAYITVFTFAMDQMINIASDAKQPEGEFPTADNLSTTLAVSHFFLLALVVWAMPSNAALGLFDTLGLFVAAGMFFGQVSNSNAHELIHRSNRRLFNLGKWVYISMLFGHHTSAHLLVHHRFAASEYDPNSAPKGESFYTFAQRAWIGSARAGFEMETGRRKNLRQKPPRFSHPYVAYTLGGVASVAIAFAIGGWGGALALIALASYAQLQLLLSDYVQHYGLRRASLPNGKLAPVALHHSWNAPHWMSNYLMLAAPRHSDHHSHPDRPYPALILPEPDVAPSLPYSLPTMGALALFPNLWRRVMDPRLATWTAHAAAEAQKIARQNAPAPT